MMRKTLLLVFMVLSLILLSSCPSPVSSNDDNSTSDPTSTVVTEAAEFFVEDSGTGETVFSLNSTSLLSSNGSTYWTSAGSGESFSTINVTMRKTSGNNVGGFGIIFAQDGSGNDQSALVFMINILGEYCVGLVADNSFEYIREWTDAGSVISGYSQYNALRIEEYDSAGRYKLFINNTEVNDFEDPSSEVHDSGNYGYLAVLTPVESFPSVPVTVYFEE